MVLQNLSEIYDITGRYITLMCFISERMVRIFLLVETLHIAQQDRYGPLSIFLASEQFCARKFKREQIEKHEIFERNC